MDRETEIINRLERIEEKLSEVAEGMAAQNARCAEHTKIVDKHTAAIYGNGKVGLIDITHQHANHIKEAQDWKLWRNVTTLGGLLTGAVALIGLILSHFLR